jgi:hypothetical protein
MVQAAFDLIEDTLGATDHRVPSGQSMEEDMTRSMGGSTSTIRNLRSLMPTPYLRQTPPLRALTRIKQEHGQIHSLQGICLPLPILVFMRIK